MVKFLFYEIYFTKRNTDNYHSLKTIKLQNFN